VTESLASSSPARPASLIEAGRIALVTGGSSGIGEGFAQALAARGLQVIVTGRNEERLQAVSRGLRERHRVRVESVNIELDEPGAPERLKAAVENLGMTPDLLVNNAGIGAVGAFQNTTLDHALQLLRVNIEALVVLTRLYLPEMLARRSGGIINVSSTAGFQPLPHFALYSASKAMVTNFSQALWGELEGTGVHVMAFCSGPVDNTRFRHNAGGRSPFADRRSQPREVAVATAIRAFERGDPLVVPGLVNGLLAQAAMYTPLKPRLLVLNRVFRRSASNEARNREAGAGGHAPRDGADGASSGGAS
jgi:short-subunit dehydrogenase